MLDKDSAELMAIVRFIRKTAILLLTEVIQLGKCRSLAATVAFWDARAARYRPANINSSPLDLEGSVSLLNVRKWRTLSPAAKHEVCDVVGEDLLKSAQSTLEKLSPGANGRDIVGTVRQARSIYDVVSSFADKVKHDWSCKLLSTSIGA